MCDVPMLMFWIWAMVLWERGLEQNKNWLLLAGGLLAGLAVLTKYNGILLLPLLGLSTFLHRRAWAWSLAGLAIPVLMLLAYEHHTARLYGEGLFHLSGRVVTEKRKLAGHDTGVQAVACITFLGGGLAGAALSAFSFWSRRVLFMGGAAVFLTLLAVFSQTPTLGSTIIRMDGVLRWQVLVQVAIWVFCGLMLVAMLATTLWRKRDRVNTLLGLWIAGGILYSVFVNWMVSGRSLLWFVPAVAILTVRGFEHAEKAAVAKLWKLGIPATLGAVIALAASFADYRFANSSRQTARNISADFRANSERPLWFTGHWGFQYYMEAMGGQALDLAQPRFQAGDWLVAPWRNVNILILPDGYVSESKIIHVQPCRWLATMHRDAGAGFYSSQIGVLPFALGPLAADDYYVQRANRALPPVMK
jgi:4-amino-4-deoxy-L-arabinose transferase-like glycosyltransferase